MLPPHPLILEGRFRLLSPLASGGMGAVFLGEQVNSGRRVAVKALRQDLNDQAEMVERFHREAQLLSKVHHPAVVGVVEFGHTDGTAYLVMELVEGENLHQLLAGAGLSTPRALRALVQLAEGLSAIHAQGIVHRDLKPENVILSQTPQGEQARLLDFGIARLAEPAPTGQVSQVGLVIGTPEYLSPEQALGGKVDARSDLYSFGVLAFQVLSGQLPFAGPGPRHFLLQHLGKPPLPLEKAAPPLAAHPTLIATVMRLLEKDPEKRFPHAQAVAEALRLALDTLPLPLATQSWEGAAQVSARPSTAVYGGAAAVARRGETLSYGSAPPPRVKEAAPTLRADKVLDEKSPSSFRRGRIQGMALGFFLLLLVGFGIWWWRQPPSEEQQVQMLLARGKPAQALAFLDTLSEQEQQDRPGLALARITALHAVGRHRREQLSVAALMPPARERVDARVLDGLAEDFGAQEDDARLRAAFAVLPEKKVRRHMEQRAAQPFSTLQWGALRYLEAQQATEGLELVQYYIAALSSEDCSIRSRAASRLASLGDPEALPALEQVLRLSPPGSSESATPCGQAEALQAVQRLQLEAP